ncbi:hypothetical protein KC19_10G056900 [Ceratodon purpureus]|uniref:Uncharacterized protein n=1 Tax=Ceratodon purpureus TaxID=3225 RepID=A0A8T0GHI7_CERPU|nr:hypothetical protein KC19_10G056900 [Ceratodon purpureus]
MKAHKVKVYSWKDSKIPVTKFHRKYRNSSLSAMVMPSTTPGIMPALLVHVNDGYKLFRGKERLSRQWNSQ